MSLLPNESANGLGARIKICGVTREVDIDACIEAEIDAVGFNLASGPRRISIRRAASLAAELPHTITSVLLVVDWSLEDIQNALETTMAGAVQLHGNEPPELAAALREHVAVIKAFRVRDADTLAAAAAYPCDIALLDAYVPGVAGGTGATWDHSLLADYSFSQPVMLAGGLRPKNVADALATTDAWAVDTASGVEAEPGIKDAAAIAAFVEAVRGE